MGRARPPDTSARELTNEAIINLARVGVNQAALRRAARESWDLPEGAVIQVGDEPLHDLTEGTIPYQMHHDGSFAPVTQPLMAKTDRNRRAAARQPI